MIDENTRILDILFVTEQKQFIQTFGKKGKSDYFLNVNKVMRDKLGQDIMIPNKIQAFLINYEIRKIIDKAINVRNRKYKRIIYINTNISANAILNTLDFLNGTYEGVVFNAYLLDLEGEFEPIKNVKIIKKPY